MIGPEWFFIGVLVWLGIRELRKWIEVCMMAGSNDTEPPEMSESVKHMYN
jgi:hypothetical protein